MAGEADRPQTLFEAAYGDDWDGFGWRRLAADKDEARRAETIAAADLADATMGGANDTPAVDNARIVLAMARGANRAASPSSTRPSSRA